DQGLGAFAVRRSMARFHLAHALDDGPPEFSQRHQRLACHHALIEHLPGHRQFHERAGAARASDVTLAAADQLEQALFPGAHANLFVHPSVGARSKEFRGDGQRAPVRFLRTARDRFHHAAVAAAANQKAACRKQPPELARLLVMRVAFPRARAAEYGHHPRPGRHGVFTGAAPISSTIASHSASKTATESLPRSRLLLSNIEKIRWAPPRVVTTPDAARTCSSEPVFARTRPAAGVSFMRLSSVPSFPATGKVEKKSSPQG